MPPGILTGSYQRYKDDQKTFTTWLSKAAVAVGYTPSDSLPVDDRSENSRQPKKKSQAESKSKAKQSGTNPATKKYTVTSKILLEQANAVAGRVELPSGLRELLVRAIDARKRCAEWYRTSKVDNQYSNDGHQHFIEVLEQTLNIIGKSASRDEKSGPSAAQISQPIPRNAESWNEITNRFQHLVVENSSELDEVTDVGSCDGESSIEFEFEEESEEMTISLMIFCFFEDLHRVQDFLHGVWTDYKARKIELIPASLITNVAMDIVSQNEQEILATAPKLFNQKRSYDTIAIVIFYANALSLGQNPDEMLESTESLIPTPFDDFIYLSTARTLMKYENLHKINVAYPMHSYPMRFRYIARPELLGTAYMNKKEAEDAVLSQYAMDHQLYDTFASSAMKQGPKKLHAPAPAEDEMSRCMRLLRQEGKLSVALVFASRIFLDIQDILGSDVARGYEDLETMTKHVDILLKSTGMQSSNGIRWLTKDVTVAQQLGNANHYLLKPMFPTLKQMMMEELGIDKSNWGVLTQGDELINSEPASQVCAATQGSTSTTYSEEAKSNAKGANIRGVSFPAKPSFSTVETRVVKLPEGHADFSQEGLRSIVSAELNLEPPSAEHEANARRLNIRLVKPHDDSNFYFTHNPVYCGVVAFASAIRLESAGILLARYHVVPMLVGHVYAESLRSGLLDTPWPEMEQLKEIQMSTMFAGTLPQSSKEAFIRFSKLMGMNMDPNIFKKHERSLPYKEPQFQVNQLSETFRPFVDCKATFHSCLKGLESMVQAHRESIYHSSKHKRRSARTKLTPLQFMMQLQDFLPGVLKSISFDYITITKTCYVLMRKFRADIMAQLKVEHRLHPTEESNQPLWPMMALKILLEAKNVEERNRPRSETAAKGPQLQVVATALKKYLDVKASVAISSV